LPDGVEFESGIWFWDVKSGSLTKRIVAHRSELTDKPSGGAICLAKCSPSGLLVVAGTTSGAVSIWETATGQKVTLIGGKQGAVTAIFFHDGDNKFISTTYGGDVVFCDLRKI